jgi:2,4-dienoyl-CoA reductase-like NADH-dependent reductase (Old Yellow Enzyme family)
LHACHGYFLDQFLWAETNRRTDRFGGPTAIERAAYVISVIEAVRCALGDLPISLRLSQWKEVDYGARIVTGPDELAGLLAAFRAAGVDMFHASTRRFWTPEWPDLHDVDRPTNRRPPVNTLRSGRMPDVPAFTKDDLLVDRELPALVQ